MTARHLASGSGHNSNSSGVLSDDLLVQQPRSYGVAVATLVMLVIMVATVVGWWVLLPEIAPKRITIAVLPFEQPVTTPGTPSHIGEGVAADIAIALAEVPDFVVLDRAASFSFRSQRDVANRLAGELGATHVVEGRIRRTAGRTELSARLTNLADFQVLWEEDLSGADAELFAMRDAVARAIAQKLVLLGDVDVSAGPPSGLDAYEAFLEARALADAGDTARASGLAERSLALDENNSYAHLLLGELYYREARPGARAHVARALAIDPGSAPARALKAHLGFQADGNLAAYHRSLTDLVARHREATALRLLACLYEAVGRRDDARTAASHLRQLDPLGVRRSSCAPFPALDPDKVRAVPWRSAEEVLAAEPAGT